MADAEITKWYGARVLTKATDVTRKAMQEATLLVESHVKQNFTVPGHGKAYKRGKNVHIASAPGEPPSVDTGTLRASIGRQIIEGPVHIDGFVGVKKGFNRQRKRSALKFDAKGKFVKGSGLMVDIGPGPDYGLYLEVGTRRMAARPYLVPALRALRSKITAIFKRRFS